MRFGKRTVSLVRVGTDADYGGTGFHEVFIGVAKRASFSRADGRVVLRVKVEHDRFVASVIFEGDLLARMYREGEVGRGVTPRYSCHG